MNRKFCCRKKRTRPNVHFFAIVAAMAIVGAIHSEISIAANNTCFEYEPTIVTLAGTIRQHMEYGPPGYGEDPAHDAKDLYWYLELDAPICVNGKKENSSGMEGEKDVRKIQIVYLNGYPKGDDWIDHRALITGTL